MRYPKNDPKSKLTLSEAPKVDRRIARARNAIFLIVVSALLYFSGSVQAYPGQPCPSQVSRCGLPTRAPRVVGLPLKAPATPTAATLPPTDTAP